MQATESLKRAIAGFLPALALVASFGARAEGAAGQVPSASPSPTAQEIEAAITEQSGRRRAAIATTVVGGLAIVAGVALAIDNCVYNCDSDDGRPADIGFAIGIPCIAWGVGTWIDSSRKARRLKRQRSQLSLAPGSDSLRLTLSYEF